MKELVIKIKWGGLGDHLFCTPIPRVAKQQGYDRVFISRHSDYVYSDTKEFIWERNPFVDGFSNEDKSYPQFGEVEEGMNLLDKLVFWWGLADDGVRFREPEIFYVPKIIPELRDAVLYDPNYNADPHRHPRAEKIERYFKNNDVCVTHQMKHGIKRRRIQDAIEIESKGVENFCDILWSCKRVFCLVTGTLPLMAALGKSATVFYSDRSLPMARHSKLHTYRRLS